MEIEIPEEVFGVKEWEAKVVSNYNVATYIKEFIVEIPEDMDYKAGGYIQIKVPEGEVYTTVESPRGELGCFIVSDGSSKPYRMHVRGPSFCNLQALPVVMSDSPIADAVAAIASLDPVLGDVDR